MRAAAIAASVAALALLAILIFWAFHRAPERRAKIINYALLYGKTAFTLAKDIGVSRKEAESFIEAYFARYPKVRTFIDDTIAKARETGQTTTIFGRIRPNDKKLFVNPHSSSLVKPWARRL